MDPYKTLGVSKTSTDEEIKKAYRKLTKKYHPDLNAGSKEAEKNFKEVGQAFELIGNKEAREKHEQASDFNSSSQQPRGTSERPFYYETQGQQGRYNNIFEGNYEDIFSSMFRGGQKQAASSDNHYTMEISIEEALEGSTKEIILPNGKQLSVKIPKGITQGTKLRFKGHGEKGHKSTGDAYVEIHFKSSKRFKLEGLDLVSELPISLDEAINGGKIEFITIDGPIILTVKPPVSSGTKLKIKGKGLGTGQSRGDQYVLINIMLPKHIDPQLSHFIKQWSKEHPYNPRAEVR